MLKVSCSIQIDPRDVPKPVDFLEFAANPSNFMQVKVDAIKRFSPDTLSLMEFKDETEYQVTEKIYGNLSVVGDEIDNWTIKFWREFDMTNARHLFNQIKQGVSLYEGKMIHQFDAYFAEPRFGYRKKI